VNGFDQKSTLLGNTVAMNAIYEPAWNDYLKHRNVEQLKEDLRTTPWYREPTNVEGSFLQRAIRASDLAAVRALLELGESPNLPAASGFTLLHTAVDEASEARNDAQRKAALSILDALTDAGADPNVQGIDGTPLHRAAGWGLIDAARILLSHGADIEARMIVDGELTPLMHAALINQPAMFQFLLSAGANRSAISGPSFVDPPMSLRALITTKVGKNAAQFLKWLDE
jgi:ankyrin repeat protein